MNISRQSARNSRGNAAPAGKGKTETLMAELQRNCPADAAAQQGKIEKTTVSFNGITWKYSRKDLSLASLACTGQIAGRMFKSSGKRLVICDPEGVFVKEIYYRGVRSLLKTIAGGTACKEGRTNLELARRGVRVPTVLAFGVDRRFGLLRRDVLLTSRVDGAASLLDLIPRLLENGVFSEKLKFIGDLACFLKALHSKGVEHTDLHVGNILASRQDGMRFHLLDLDRVRLHENALSERRADRNLALLLCTFWYCSGSLDRLHFLKRYAGLAHLKGQSKRIQEIIQAALAISHRVWDKKTVRCLHTNSRFTKSKSGYFTIYRLNRPGIERALNFLLPDPDLILNEGDILKNGRTVKAARVEIEGKSYFLKRYNCKGNLYRIRNGFRRCRAVRTWLASWGLTVRNLPVPTALICLEERQLGMLERSYILYEYMNGRRLCDIWPMLDDYEKRRLLSRIAIICGNMHRFGGYHGDLKWPNILVNNVQGRFHVALSDLDGTRVSGKLSERKARKDVERFLVDLRKAGESDKLVESFLKTWRRWAMTGFRGSSSERSR